MALKQSCCESAEREPACSQMFAFLTVVSLARRISGLYTRPDYYNLDFALTLDEPFSGETLVIYTLSIQSGLFRIFLVDFLYTIFLSLQLNPKLEFRSSLKLK